MGHLQVSSMLFLNMRMLHIPQLIVRDLPGKEVFTIIVHHMSYKWDWVFGKIWNIISGFVPYWFCNFPREIDVACLQDNSLVNRLLRAYWLWTVVIRQPSSERKRFLCVFFGAFSSSKSKSVKAGGVSSTVILYQCIVWRFGQRDRIRNVKVIAIIAGLISPLKPMVGITWDTNRQSTLLYIKTD